MKNSIKYIVEGGEMIATIWTKKYMLRPAAHCRSGC